MFLWEMLYQSLYVPDGGAPFDHNVLGQPEIARYVKDWGLEGDSGFVAVDEENRPVGAIWLRLFRADEKGFGYVDDHTPELGIAVLPLYRGQGIGTMLLTRLIDAAEADYRAISLSVASENPAVHLYQRLGFEVVNRHDNSLIMQKEFGSSELDSGT
jgi:ribosomal protein S18 acetylase RimI-like enzyme